MPIAARAINALPRRAQLAVRRAQRGWRQTTTQVRYGIAEWLGLPTSDQPAPGRQRGDRVARNAPPELQFDDLDRCERQARNGQIAPLIGFWRQVLGRDGHLRSAAERRSSAIEREWSVVPGGDQPEDEFARDFIASQIEQLGPLRFRGVLSHLAWHDTFSFAAAEVDFVHRDGIWSWQHVEPVPHEYFRVATHAERGKDNDATLGELLLDTETGRPERLIPGKWVVATRWMPLSLIESALMWPASYWSLFKLKAARNFVLTDDTNGQPFIHATTPDDPTEELKDTLLRIPELIGRLRGAATWGHEVKIETANLDTSAAVECHERVIGLGDAVHSKLFIGGTLVNDNKADGAASYALGQVHDAGFWIVVLPGALRIEATVSEQLFRPLLRFNGIAAATPQLRIRVLPELDAATLVKLASILQNKLGIAVSVQHLREMTALPAPKNDEDRTHPQQTAA